MNIKAALIFAFTLAATACPALAELPWAGVSPDSTGCYDIPWLGKVYESGTNGWVRHEQLGWIYVTGDSAKSVYIYKTGAGWLWTSADSAFHMYSYDLGGWIYYCAGTSNPQWFYDYTHNVWTRDLMNGAEVQSLDTMLAYLAQKSGVPAIACAVVQNGKIVAHGQGGVIYTGSTTAVDASSKWTIGSITKSMTCILAEKMVEAGLISWDEKLPDLLPDVAMNEGWNDVTLEQLAKHTAGLDDDTIIAGFDTSAISTVPSTGRTQIATSVLANAPSWTPGTKYQYSSVGYILIGAILERRAGVTYEQALVSQVLAPLGLNSYGFLNPAAGDNAEIQPWGHNNGTPLNPSVPAILPAAIPAGGVNLTIDDLARYISANLAGQQGLCPLLAKDDWTTLHYDASDANASYAFAWEIGTYDAQLGPNGFSHAGGDGAFTSTVVASPALDMCIALATNEGNETLATQALYSVYLNILNDYLGDSN